MQHVRDYPEPCIRTVIQDTTTVTITVTDEYGNSVQCTFDVNTDITPTL